ncbi:MAG: hypothetical protein ACR2LA_11185 [Acidimicrobiales bacterium]
MAAVDLLVAYPVLHVGGDGQGGSGGHRFMVGMGEGVGDGVTDVGRQGIGVLVTADAAVGETPVEQRITCQVVGRGFGVGRGRPVEGDHVRLGGRRQHTHQAGNSEAVDDACCGVDPASQI